MKKFGEMFAPILAAVLIAQPIVAIAGNTGRIIPNGKIGIISEGKEVGQIKSEAPVPEGLLMVCDGNCIMQAHGLQLVAQDKSVFAVTEASERWDVAVKNGRIDFGVKADSKSLAFHTPTDVIQVQQVIVPASSEGLVRGSVTVTDKGTELAVTEGMLKVAYNGTQQVVQPGEPIVLAQTGAVTGGTAVAGGTGAGITTTGAIVAGTVAVVGIGAGVAATAGSDSNEVQQLSKF